MRTNVNVLCVLGTRPEAIKLAPVIHELHRRGAADRLNGVVRVIVCVTGQRRVMLDQMLRLFRISPDHDLDVMENTQSPSQVASAVLARLEPILKAASPTWVLVQGDTTTAAAASLAAFYASAKVAHVEAGLRTRDKRHPFPEEINRRLVGAIADRHFAPTERARQNLLMEGISDSSVCVTGNTVVDAMRWAARLPLPASLLELFARAGVPAGSADAEPPGLAPAPRNILVTAPRPGNFGTPPESICLAPRAPAP